MEELAEHGVFLPPNMQGLTDEQIEELKLKDEWGGSVCPVEGLFLRRTRSGGGTGKVTGSLSLLPLLPCITSDLKAVL